MKNIIRAAALSAIFAAASQAQAPAVQPPRITTSGEAQVRVTPDRARVLFGLGSDEVSSSILNRLAGDGFLDMTANGEFVRRKITP